MADLNALPRASVIVKRVRVDRDRSPNEAIDATGRERFTYHPDVDDMPRGNSEEVDVHFFQPEPREYNTNGFMNNEQLATAYERRGLTPDPRAQAAVNEENTLFANEYPNASQYKNKSGRWCVLFFYNDHTVGPSVEVVRLQRRYLHATKWYFSGVPISS